jgi:hypothetical protein
MNTWAFVKGVEQMLLGEAADEVCAGIPPARDGFAIGFPMIRKLRLLKLYFY